MLYLNIALMGLVSALGYVLLAEPVHVAEPQDTAPAPLALSDMQIEEVQLEFPDRSEFAAIARRPLFSPERRPYRPDASPEEPQVPQADIPPPRVVLSGIVTVGEERRALMALPREPAELYRTGQALRGWRVGEITDDAVELVFGVRTHIVELDGEEKGSDGREGAPESSRRRAPAAAPLVDMTDQID